MIDEAEADRVALILSRFQQELQSRKKRAVLARMMQRLKIKKELNEKSAKLKLISDYGKKNTQQYRSKNAFRKWFKMMLWKKQVKEKSLKGYVNK